MAEPANPVGADFPKGSIGNYKGVMLCNRPNEFGGQRAPDRTGDMPFNSRVDPKVPIGWNPPPKLAVKTKKQKKCAGALKKHREFLNKLEQQKQQEFDMKYYAHEEEMAKQARIREQTQKQRDKMRQVQAEYNQEQDDQMEFPEPESSPPIEEPAADIGRPDKLSKENLSQFGNESQKSASKLKPKKGKTRPAWAVTKKMEEEEKEQEIDDLIEFAYDLDYEQYMEDYEVRQALAIIKDRVKEIKKDDEWKQNMADEWNQAAANSEKKPKDTQSVYSYKSGVSRTSYKSRVNEEMKKFQEKAQSEWDATTVNSEIRKMSTEERMARRIAKEVLRDNKKLGNVHSGASIQKLLEREAKKHLENTESVAGPVINQIATRGTVDPANPSTLPYLHKNPAI